MTPLTAQRQSVTYRAPLLATLLNLGFAVCGLAWSAVNQRHPPASVVNSSPSNTASLSPGQPSMNGSKSEPSLPSPTGHPLAPTPPDPGLPAEPAPSEPHVYWRERWEGNSYYISNLSYGPIVVHLRMKRTVPGGGQVQIARDMFIAGRTSFDGSEAFILTLPKGAELKGTIEYLPGYPGAHPDGTVYQLPFSHSYSYRVQSVEHENYTFDVPRYTPIHAVRGGVVAMVDGRYDSSKVAWPECNYVFVLHSDNTLGLYSPFEPGSVKVVPGQQVAAGEPLGLSGKSPPEFSVARGSKKMVKSWENLHVQFSANGRTQSLEAGQTYH